MWSHAISSGAKIYANRYVAGEGWSGLSAVETQYTYSAYPQVAMNAGGSAVVLWNNSASSLARVQVNRYDPATGWGNYQTLSLLETYATAYFLDVGIDAAGNALASWIVNGGADSLMVSRYTPATGWETPATHTYDPLSMTSNVLAMSAAGDATLTWVQWDGTTQNLWASRYTAGGVWSPAVLLETGAKPTSPAHVAQSDNGDTLVVWQQDEAGATRAWVNLYAVRAGDLPPNSAPTANAGPDQSVLKSTTATLSGSGTDADGTIIGYGWKQIEGPTVTLSAPNAATTSFTAPVVKKATNLVFELTVLDNVGGIATDQVTVTVTTR